MTTTTKTSIVLMRRYRFLRESGGASRLTARTNIVRFAAVDRFRP